MVSLSDACKQTFLEIASDINGALIYLDDGAGEFAHVSLGLSFLYGLGAAHVCKLEDAKPSDACLSILFQQPVTTLVVCITQLLTDAHAHIVRAILAHPGVSRLQIISSVSEHAHSCSGSTVLSVEAFTEYAAILRQDLQDAVLGLPPGTAAPSPSGLLISVRHAPLYMCALDNLLFVLPAASSAATMARSGGRASGFGPADPPAEDDGEGVQAGVSLLAHALAAISAQLGLRPHVFAVGQVSQQIGHELSTLPPPPSSAEVGGDVAVVIVDRSLDLASPALHHDHILDSMLAALPRRPVAPPPPSAPPDTRCQWRPVDARCEVPGWFPLAGPLRGEHAVLGAEVVGGDEAWGAGAPGWLEQLAGRRGKDATMYIRKWLKEALRQEKLQPNVRSKMGSVTPAELAGLAEALAAEPGAAVRHQSVMTLGFAAAAALAPPHGDRWEAAAALERQLIMMVAEDSSAAAQTLVDALRTAAEAKGPLQVGDVLSALLVLYSLAGDHHQSGPFAKADEAAVRGALSAALESAPAAQLGFLGALAQHLEQDRLASTSGTGQHAAGLQQEVQRRVADFFSQLHYAAAARSGLKELRHLAAPGAAGGAEGSAPVVPLLRQLVDLILQRQDLTDVAQPTSALRGLLSMGLGRFGLHQSSAKPGDFQTVLVFVVGGVSMAEAREVRQELEVHPGLGRTRVLLGGTSLLTPSDVVRCAFG